VTGAGEGGYARALSGDETLAQQHAPTSRSPRFDVVITTAGPRPPASHPGPANAVKGMRAGPSWSTWLTTSPLAWCSPTRARSSTGRRPDCCPEVPPEYRLLTAVTVFVLALLVGVEVISKVPATPHTPLSPAPTHPRHRPGRRDAHHGNSPRSPRIRVEANGTSGGELGPAVLRRRGPAVPGRCRFGGCGTCQHVSTVAPYRALVAGTHHDDGAKAGR